jgi:hypothetical protein
MSERYPKIYHAHIEDYAVPTVDPNVWINGWEFADRVKCAKESADISAAQIEAILRLKARATEEAS